VPARGSFEEKEKPFAIVVVEEDRLLVVAARANVITGARHFGPRAMHLSMIAPPDAIVIGCGSFVPLLLQRLPPDTGRCGRG